MDGMYDMQRGKADTLGNLRLLVSRLAEAVIELSAEPAVTTPQLVTFEQAGTMLAVGRTTIQEMVDSGELPVVSVTPRAVRIDVRDVEKLIVARRARRS